MSGARPPRRPTTSAPFSGPTPYVLLFVLGLSFILLLLAFRSLVVALVSILLNLLSIGAAYGLLTLVFINGVGACFFDFQKVTAIDAWVPLFLFSVLFALSMDYQFFLMSRIKERYDETGSTTEAVVGGVASTAKIITGAALIIVVVFSGFARGQLDMFQQMGFGVAVALLLDATLIRSIVLPCTLSLLGYAQLVPAPLAQLAATIGGRVGARSSENCESGAHSQPGRGVGDRSSRDLRAPAFSRSAPLTSERVPRRTPCLGGSLRGRQGQAAGLRSRAKPRDRGRRWSFSWPWERQHRRRGSRIGRGRAPIRSGLASASRPVDRPPPSSGPLRGLAREPG